MEQFKNKANNVFCEAYRGLYYATLSALRAEALIGEKRSMYHVRAIAQEKIQAYGL